MRNRVEFVSKKEYRTKDLIAACEAVNLSMLNALPNIISATDISDGFSIRVSGQHSRFARVQRIRRIGRSAAVVVLALLISFSAVLTANASVREAFARWWKEVFVDRVVYYFEGSPDIQIPSGFSLGWLPEGFELIDSDVDDTSAFYTYGSKTGESFVFYYEQIDSIILTEYVPLGDYSHETVRILNKTADLYTDNKIAGNLTVIWVDDENHYILCFDAIMARDKLLKIAESVIAK